MPKKFSIADQTVQSVDVTVHVPELDCASDVSIHRVLNNFHEAIGAPPQEIELYDPAVFQTLSSSGDNAERLCTETRNESRIRALLGALQQVRFYRGEENLWHLLAIEFGNALRVYYEDLAAHDRRFKFSHFIQSLGLREWQVDRLLHWDTL